MSSDRPAGLFGRLIRSIRPEPVGAASHAVVRRLAAIVATDMVGYSKLMGADEAGTLAALRGLRQEIIDPKIAAHRGRIVKTTGDGLLVEFASVVDAVQCAIAVQDAVLVSGANAPEEKRISFRIGVNLGEIILEGDDIYGDGVNIAARLEQLAQPGGICISHTVYKECRGRVEAGFADGGERELKNIARPVHVWHWQSAAAVAVPLTVEAVESKPSIAVLPFVNMSSDKEQEYFADGMTEDIITGLSCDSRLFVIARNSTFAYKGQHPDIRTVGKELGVRYVLEGSIRPIGERLRITVQLIDTASGAHVWADRIDRPIAEIFDIMDDVVDGLVTSLCSNLGMAEGKRAARARPEDLQAWALCVQAETVFFSQPSAESLAAAEKLAGRATEIEPGYGPGWATLACLLFFKQIVGLRTDAVRDVEQAVSCANKALGLAPNDPVVLGHCGYALSEAGQAMRGIEYLEKSLALNPNNGVVRLRYGQALSKDGRHEAAIAQLDLFMRHSPKDPIAWSAGPCYTWSYLLLDEPLQAERFARSAVNVAANHAGLHQLLACSLAALGRVDEAQQSIRIMRQLAPDWTLQSIEKYWRFWFRRPEDAEKLIALARQAWVE